MVFAYVWDRHRLENYLHRGDDPDYEYENIGNPGIGICHINKYGNVVIINTHTDHTGMSTTNAIESIVSQFCNQHDLDYRTLTVIETNHHSTGKIYFQIVNSPVDQPSWRGISEEDLEKLLGKNFSDYMSKLSQPDYSKDQ